MVTIKKNNGDIAFLNENEFVYILYEKGKGIVNTCPKDRNNFVVTDVKEIAFGAESVNVEVVDYTDKPLRELEIDIPIHWVRFKNVAIANDIYTVGDLLKISPEKFITFRNSGYKCMAAVKKALKEKYNIDWN